MGTLMVNLFHTETGDILGVGIILAIFPNTVVVAIVKQMEDVADVYPVGSLHNFLLEDVQLLPVQPDETSASKLTRLS